MVYGQGRQDKEVGNNNRESTDLEFAKSKRAVENKEKWRKLVAKSSVVPRRPSRLRDDDDIKQNFEGVIRPEVTI